MHTEIIKQELIASIFLAVLWLVACANTRPPPDLTGLTPFPSPIVHEIVPLRAAIAAVISPQRTVASYTSPLQYVNTKLKMIEIVENEGVHQTL